MDDNNSGQSQFCDLLSKLKLQIDDANKFLRETISQQRNEHADFQKGISLLDVKNNLMMNYLIDLSFLMTDKLNEKSIKAHPSLQRLIEHRVAMERLRPIECKLKYQVDKLIKVATTHKLGESDPLRHRPNLSNFDAQDDDMNSDENGAESEDGQMKPNSGAYVPPKLMAVPYQDGTENRADRALERAKRRAVNSSLVRDLQEQYGEGPVEITEQSQRRRKQLDSSKKRTEYEEDNFMRIQLTKMDRKAEKRHQSKGDSTLDYLLNFGDYNVDEISNKNTKKFRASDSKKKESKVTKKKRKFGKKK